MDVTAMELWKMLIDAIQLVAIVILWINRKNQVTADAVAQWEHKVNDRIDHSQLEIAKIQTKLQNMPEFRNMEEMNERIHGVDNRLSTVVGQLHGIEKKLSMIDQHLMNKG